MPPPITAAAVAAAVALTTSMCGSLTGEPGKADHDATVRQLEAAVAQEDGWEVVTVPISHEGGGSTTWWLPPCDGDQRTATTTGYSGSDVQDIPGTWFVEERTVPCTEPDRDVTIDGRTFTFDTPMVELAGGWAPTGTSDSVTFTDQATGRRHEVVASHGPVVIDPCDGTTSWSAYWFGTIEFQRQGCLGTLAALPDEILALVPDADPDLDHAVVTDGWAGPITDTFATLDRWTATRVELLTFDGPTTYPAWEGPCQDLPDGGRARTVVELPDDHTLTVHDRPCR